MPRYVTCGPDSFAAGIEELIGDIPDKCGEGCTKAVKASIRKAASGLRSGAYGSSGKTAWSGEYLGGFSSAMLSGGMTPAGEVGNKAKPGLVHLLEKGHIVYVPRSGMAVPTGRRTGAFPHMAPAFDDTVSFFVSRVMEYVSEAL